MFLPSFSSCHYHSFEYISEFLTFPKDTTNNLRYGWHLIVFYLFFMGFMLCFHRTSFGYGVKRVRDVGPTCRCHQSNIMPDSIFSVNIAPCISYGQMCLFVFCFVLRVCLRLIFWTPFIRRGKVLSFLTIA